jgi:hypothetical protein
MQNRKKIACMAIDRIVNGQFVRGMVVFINAILCHYIFKNSAVDKKANVSMSMVTHVLKSKKVSYKVEKAILEYVYSDFIKGYPGFNRTFNFLCVACHLSIISQNFVECKHNLKKKTKKNLMKSEEIDEHMG